MRRLAFAGLLVAVATGTAAADEYNMVAAGCMPSMENYYDSPGFSPFIRYTTTDDAVGFHPTNPPPGPLRFYCPIPRSLGTVTHLAILYSLASGGHISAELYAVDKADGTSTNLGTAHEVSGQSVNDIPISVTWDPSRFMYYVLIEINADGGFWPNNTRLNLISIF